MGLFGKSKTPRKPEPPKQIAGVARVQAAREASLAKRSAAAGAIPASPFRRGVNVTVLIEGAQVTGRIQAVEQRGHKIDVRIIQPGHQDNGRVMKFDPPSVKLADSTVPAADTDKGTGT